MSGRKYANQSRRVLPVTVTSRKTGKALPRATATVRENTAVYNTLEDLSAPSIYGHGGPTVLGGDVREGWKEVSPTARRMDRHRTKANQIKQSRNKKKKT